MQFVVVRQQATGTIVPVSSIRIGVDVGGTKIEAVALDGSREAARRRLDTPRGDYASTVDAIVAVVRRVEEDVGAQGTIGVGIPGTLSPATGLVKNANSVWLIGRPFGADLEARLRREVRLANDANCFAVSEAADGAAAGAEVVFGVIVGTGTGAGIVIRGRVLTGPNAIAGEWGHNPLPWAQHDEWPGPDCYCGKHGCIETFLSGPAMTADYARRTGQGAAAPDIVARAEAGERAAEETLARYEARMARALAGVINVLDPDVIVLGGGLSNIDRLYHRVPRLWDEHVFGAVVGRPPTAGGCLNGGQRREPVRTRLVRAAHGDASGVRGAAWLWP
jgi:fructokinase